MRSVLLISVLALFALSNAQSCSNSCSYVYDNRTGNVTGTKELYDDRYNNSSTSFRTGVFTINGLFECPAIANQYNLNQYEHLRFRKLNGNEEGWQPLIIKLFASTVPAEIFGRPNSDNKISGKQTLNNWKDGSKMNLQISDHIPNSYSIYLNSKQLSYNYNNGWKDFKDKRLGTINNICSDLTCMQYKYIMICNNTELQPKICDVSQPSEYQDLNLGSDYSLRCGGTGVPYLEVNWKFKPSFGVEKNVEKNVSTVGVATTDDHTIKSQINITQFSLDDLGIYTCSVTNKNYKNSTSHTFTLDYKQGINVVASHTPKFYKVSDLPITFTWNITGNSFFTLFSFSDFHNLLLLKSLLLFSFLINLL